MERVQRHSESERLDALNALQILHSAHLPEYDAVVTTLAAIFDCPMAFITIVGKDELWFKAKYGVEAASTPRDGTFCDRAVLSRELLVVPDALKDPRFRDTRLVVKPPYTRFYAGFPLSLDGKHMLGTLCVVDTKPRRPSEAKLAQLRQLGTVVLGLMKSHRAEHETRLALAKAEEQHQLAVREGDLLEEITQVTGVGGWEVDIETDAVTWTDKTREIHEVGDDYTPNIDEAISFYAPQCHQRISDAIAGSMSNGTSWDLELPFITARGRDIWVRSAGRPIQENGTVKRLVGSFQDITERKLAEQAVRHSESVHRTTLETLREGVLVVSRTGHIQSHNTAAAALLGMAGEELSGMAVQDLDLSFRTEAGNADPDLLLRAVKEPETVNNHLANLHVAGEPVPLWLRIDANAASGSEETGLDVSIVSLADISATRRQTEVLQLIFDNLPGGLVYYDNDRRLQICNEEFKELLNIPQDLIDRKAHVREVAAFLAYRGDYGPGDAEKLVEQRFKELESTEPHVYERASEDGKFIEVRSIPLPSGALVANFFDVTERKRMEEQLADSERLARLRNDELEAILANMRQGVSVFDASGKLILWNRQYIEIFGKPAWEVRRGVSLAELIRAEQQRGEFEGDVDEYVMDLLIQLSAGESVRSKFVHPNGKIISAHHAPMPGGGWIGTHEDVTARELAAEKIKYAAHHDTLTGLANRTLFNTRLEETVSKVAGSGRSGDLMLLDLDRFKPVNDTYGHDVGDDLLKQVARRLSDCVRSSDLIARLGGDEFAIILMGTGERTAEIAERIVSSLEQPFNALGHSVSIGVSVGISSISNDCPEASRVFKQADTALYQVKHNGRNGYRFYAEALLTHTA